MRAIVGIILVFCRRSFTVSVPDAVSIYLWTDENNRMHITEEAKRRQRG